MQKSRIAVLTLTAVATVLVARIGPAPAAPAASADTWFTSWASSQQRASGTELSDQSVRMITHLSQGGDSLRIRVQNQFGPAPLTVAATSVALSDGTGASTVDGTGQAVTFGGSASVTVGAGADEWSDPVPLATTPQQDVAVSMYVSGPATPGEHAEAFRTNWATPAGSGDHVGDQDGAAYTRTTGSTWIVSAVDVHNPAVRGAIVTYGSSVVDGTGSTNCGDGCTRTGNNERWSDVLARRITAELPAGSRLAVANEGIGGTTSATDCPGESSGVVGLESGPRLDRDVLALHGVTGVIFYYGTNDLPANCTSQQILASWTSAFERLHAAGIKVYVVPTTPRPGYTDQMNRYRWDLGTFAKNRNNCGGACDGVIDFDQVIKDAVQPNTINQAYDVGDGIHVNIAGQQAEARTVSLPMLLASAG
jgi:lysophospholipase L1-like esterase